MTEIENLLAALRHAHDGDPWHGPSRAAVLADVSARDAAGRPPGGVHTIWELVLHMAAWTDEVTRRLRGSTPQLPAQGDWPPMPPTPSETEWAAARGALNAAHREVVSTLEAMSPAQLADRVGAERDAALGTGVSMGGM